MITLRLLRCTHHKHPYNAIQGIPLSNAKQSGISTALRHLSTAQQTAALRPKPHREIEKQQEQLSSSSPHSDDEYIEDEAFSLSPFSSSSDPVAVRSSSLPTHLHGYPITRTLLPCAAPTFQDLRVPSHLYHKAAALGIHKPTLIQSAAIPHLMRKPPTNSSSLLYSFPDVLIQDVSGEGKTLAYLFPILGQVTPYLHELQAIICVPTRELAVQVDKMIAELNSGGSKARQRNPIRVDLCVGHVNPSMCASLTKPRTIPLSHADSLNPAVPPVTFSSAYNDQLPIPPTPRPHIIVGTPHVIHDVLLVHQLLDTRHLKYVILDEIDHLMNKSAAAPYIIPLIRLKHQVPQKLLTETPSPQTHIEDNLTKQQLQLLKDHPRTQVVLVSAALTPAVLHLAASYLSRKRVLITAASVPDECQRRRRLIAATETTHISKTGIQRTVVHQQLQMPDNLVHHFVTLPEGVTRDQKGHMLLQLCLAIRASVQAKHPPALNAQTPMWIRHMTSKLKGGLAALPPTPSKPVPQTTAVLFKNYHDIFPLVSMFVRSGLRVGLLTSISSRSERREALAAFPTPDVILCEAALVSRGLDIKALSHIVNFTPPHSSIDYLYRAGRVGRKGSIHAQQGTVITMIAHGQADEKTLADMVATLGGNGVTQLVVRGERLYERKKRVYRSDSQQIQWQQRKQQLAAAKRVSALAQPVDFLRSLTAPQRKAPQARRSPALRQRMH